MLDFQRYIGSHNIPIFFQKLGSSFKSVSLQWIVFVGSADDPTFGLPGLFHWFEHVPFRGTKRFPHGPQDTVSRFERHAGSVNAATSATHTSYEAHVLKAQWREALGLLTDLVSNPLLRGADIEAEREIIYEEITEHTSDPISWSMDEIHKRLWGNHPFAHEVCGTIASLKHMDPAILRTSHEGAYDRSRCAFLIAGDLSPEEVLEAVNEESDQLPNHSLPERRKAIEHVPFPKWVGRCEKIKASFPSSGAVMLFPTVAYESKRERSKWAMLKALLDTGENAPLNRIIRQERRLAYGSHVISRTLPGGGYWGLATQSRAKNIEAIRAGYRDVIASDQLRSRAWFEYVRDHLLAERNMIVRSPENYTSETEDQVVALGDTISEDEAYQTFQSITHEEVLELIENIDADNSREFLIKGRA